ncbi:MAG: hypothetical protein JOY96_05640 [Verrucomicrobia bacterium]|nr:hypothetical protein [Verrucomicrobiota bacterium]MBV9673062.1 hypothetical protein [Verrucomicrobiota bacterium]
MASKTNKVLPGQRWALALMVAFLLAMSLAAGTVVLDSWDRAKLESIREPFSTGDPITLGVDPLQHPGREVLRKGGTAYFLRGKQILNLNEYEVLRAGLDDSGKIRLYRTPEMNSILVKVGVGKFLQLEPR